MRTSVHISLPESMRDWIEDQVEQGGYGSFSEYVRKLLRDEQNRQIREQIDEKLLAALKSERIEVTPEFWKKLRRDARAKWKAHKSR